MIRVIMRGCNGRMGQIIRGLIAEDKNAEIVAGVDISNHIQNEFPVFESIAECDVEADVVIDFSAADMTDELLDVCVERKLPLVLCTTGLTESHMEHLKEASGQIPVFKSANMSLGINLLLDLIKKATAVLAPAGFDMEIVEKHHNQKKDAPSGTALMLAEAINEVLENPYKYVFDRSQDLEKRTKEEIGISAVRGGTIVGEHEVIFAGNDEVIEIKHTAYSRTVFGKGAVEAAKFLVGKEPGLYNMSHVIK